MIIKSCMAYLCVQDQGGGGRTDGDGGGVIVCPGPDVKIGIRIGISRLGSHSDNTLHE